MSRALALSQFRRIALAATLGLAVALPSHAVSEISVGMSMLPVASVALLGGAASVAAAGVVVAPSVFLAGGAVLTVKAVESTARGTVYVLERASDGARFSVEVAGSTVAAASMTVGASVAASVIGTGVVLSAAGELIAFLPNELGKALLYNERVTR